MNKNQPAIVVLTVLIFFIEGNITAGAVVRFFAVGAQNKLLMVDNLVKVLKNLSGFVSIAIKNILLIWEVLKNKKMLTNLMK